MIHGANPRRMITKVLIANRGEIALRVIRTCQRLGIATVAVFSDADADSLHVRLANEAVYIGASPASSSYLDSSKIIQAALQTKADAVHPGYGFLSENAAFAQAVETAGLVWIGPSPFSITRMGSKQQAKIMLKPNKKVPLIPGYDGDDQNDETLRKEALKIGFPVLLKAASGGGGKGMKIVREESALLGEIKSAKREAQNSFGDSTLIIEKYIETARHVEIQIFGDKHGNVISLHERECTIQRRYQKVSGLVFLILCPLLSSFACRPSAHSPRLSRKRQVPLSTSSFVPRFVSSLHLFPSRVVSSRALLVLQQTKETPAQTFS